MAASSIYFSGLRQTQTQLVLAGIHIIGVSEDYIGTIFANEGSPHQVSVFVAVLKKIASILIRKSYFHVHLYTIFVLDALLFDIFEYYTKRHTFILRIKNKGIAMGILIVMLLASCLFMFLNEALPFIYFQF